MKSDPNYKDYLNSWSELYENKNYNKGLSGYFLSGSHRWCEEAFGNDIHIGKVLEIGAGTGMHLKYIRHTFDSYIASDLNTEFLQKIITTQNNTVSGNIIVKRENACELSFPDHSFDRVIAAHVLEHIKDPHIVLREWVRVLKPGGILSLVLPCDPGLAWRMGRYFFVRRKYKKTNLNYDYWMAREHINSINNLVSLVRYYFTDIEEIWKPLRIPSIDLNLFYIVHIKN